jgi:hypothetical protein
MGDGPFEGQVRAQHPHLCDGLQTRAAGRYTWLMAGFVVLMVVLFALFAWLAREEG